MTPEIVFSLDPDNGAPIYRQIIRQIEYAILSGRMRPGDRLPTIRALAVELKTNPNTIAKAYGELEIRGILTTQVGSGTYISDKKPAPEDSESKERLNRKIREVLDRFIREMRNLGVDKRELAGMIEEYREGSGEQGVARCELEAGAGEHEEAAVW
ncbi:MAG: GntR family transcriptional regulator [Treponema sp.]|jgi:GntR family transcriptional regulator|nr:GntR family transcriptional regulator [Treponema sp.]